MPPYRQVLIISQTESISTAEAELRLRTVAQHIGLQQVPPIMRVHRAGSTPMATGQVLYQAYRAMGRGGPALYVVGGSTQGGALSLLITDWGNTVLAPNDGTLGLLAAYLTQRNIPFSLHQLALDSLISAEQHRMENPDWQPSSMFALRDVLAPAAATLLAGLPVSKLTQGGTLTAARGVQAVQPGFVQQLATLSQRLGQAVPLLGLRQTNGTYLLNATLDALSFQQLRDEQATFTLTLPPPRQWLLFHHTHTLHAVQAEESTGLQLSPHAAPVWDEFFLALHVPCHHPVWQQPVAHLTLTRRR